MVSARQGARFAAGVVAAGIASWQTAACWWVVLAVDADSLAWRLMWGGLLIGVLVVSQTACWVVATVALDRSWRRWSGAAPGPLAAGLCWLLAFAVGTTLRQLTWAGVGYASLSSATLDLPGLAALFPLIGAQGVDIALMGLAVSLALSLQWLPKPGPAMTFRQSGRSLGVFTAGCLSMVLLPRLSSEPWTRDTGALLDVVAVQTGAARGVEWTLARRDEALDRVEAVIEVAAPGTVIATPEGFIGEVPPDVPEGRFGELLQHAAANGVHVLLGMPTLVRGADGPQLMNSVVQLSPGRRAVYAKERLVPGAEFLPWPSVFEFVYRSAFSGRFRSQTPASPEMVRPMFLGSTEVGMSICYEQAFAYTMLERAHGAGLIANLSDDDWIDASAYRQQMRATARLRALEVAKPVLRVASGSRSMLVDHLGRVLQTAHGTGRELVRFAVSPREGETPYAKAWRVIAFGPILLWILAVLGFGFLPRPARLTGALLGKTT